MGMKRLQYKADSHCSGWGSYKQILQIHNFVFSLFCYLHFEMRTRCSWTTVGTKEGAGLGVFESLFSVTLVLGTGSSLPHSLSDGWPHSAFLTYLGIHFESRFDTYIFSQH